MVHSGVGLSWPLPNAAVHFSEGTYDITTTPLPTFELYGSSQLAPCALRAYVVSLRKVLRRSSKCDIVHV